MRGIQAHESTELDFGLPDWIKPTMIARAKKRLEDVTRLCAGSYQVKGRPSMDDEYDHYLVTRDHSGKWSCDCSNHAGGQYRSSNCSHSVAVRIFAAIPDTREVSVLPASCRVVESVEPAKSRVIFGYKVELPELKLSSTEKETTETSLDHWSEKYFEDFTGFAMEEQSEAVENDFGFSVEEWRSNQEILSSSRDEEEEALIRGALTQISIKPIDSLELPPWANGLNKSQRFALEATAEAIKKGKRNILLEGPVGMGKTLYGRLVAQMLGARVNYICSTKPLQEQFYSDFSESKILKGRNNYKAADSHLTCDKCNYKKEKGCTLCIPFVREDGTIDARSSKRKCPYQKAKAAAQAAECSVLNTQYFLVANQFGAAGYDNQAGALGFDPQAKISHGFAHRGVSIFDEADELEKSLMGFIELVIGTKILEHFEETPPATSSRWSKRSEWLNGLAEKLRDYISEQTGDSIEEDEDEDPFLKLCRETLGRILDVKEDIEKLSDRTAEDQEPWVYEVRDEKDKGKTATFKPVRVGKYGNKYLFCHSLINIVMSGTVLTPDQFAADIGLENFEFIRVESTFPAERRPVFVRPVASMNYKNKADSMPRVAKECLEIRKKYPGRMLIHTVSYELTRFLQSYFSEHGFDVISYVNASERDHAIHQLRRTKDGILLAPSMDRGVNLKDDLCRIVVIPKIPFPSLGDKQISRRSRQPTKQEGEVWYRSSTLRTIIQMTGRGMRHEKDWCRTFILDDQFLRLHKEMKHFMPNWFLSGLVFDNKDPITEHGIDTS